MGHHDNERTCAVCGNDDVFRRVPDVKHWQAVVDRFDDEDCERAPIVSSYLCADCWEEAGLDDV